MRKKKNEEENNSVEIKEQIIDPTIELLKELIKVNQEIKEILLKLKDRFI